MFNPYLIISFCCAACKTRQSEEFFLFVWNVIETIQHFGIFDIFHLNCKDVICEFLRFTRQTLFSACIATNHSTKFSANFSRMLIKYQWQNERKINFYLTVYKDLQIFRRRLIYNISFQYLSLFLHHKFYFIFLHTVMLVCFLELSW